MPEAYAELCRIYGILEKHYRDMQDMEFTIQEGKLWMLQTRSGKRTAKAALRIAVELAQEGLISQEEAVGRVEPGALDQLLHPMIDPKAERRVLTTGLPASPGAAAARSSSTRTRPRTPARPAARSSWCGSRPRRRTFTACTLPKAS